jgi:hypothetical protein
MTIDQILIATLAASLLISVVYTHTRWSRIIEVYKMWFTKNYWTDYNIIEALSWFTKAMIIVPGLIFGIQVWWFYFLTLITSLTLIWASNKKLLPTLVAFNTLWVWISCMVLTQHLVK